MTNLSNNDKIINKNIRNSLNLNNLIHLNYNTNNNSNQYLDNTNNQLVNDDNTKNINMIKIINNYDKKVNNCKNFLNIKNASDLSSANNKNNDNNISEKNIYENNKNIDNFSKSIINFDDKVKGIFNYHICLCKKNKEYDKMKALIRKDLSIENILKIVNSHEIIKNILIEKNFLKSDVKINFFSKAKINFNNTLKNKDFVI